MPAARYDGGMFFWGAVIVFGIIVIGAIAGLVTMLVIGKGNK